MEEVSRLSWVYGPSTRELSRRACRACGLPDPAHLPLLDGGLRSRSVPEIEDRCLVLTALVAVSFGLDRTAATRWLASENLEAQLSLCEKRFLADLTDQVAAIQDQVECIWALSWCLGLVDEMDPRIACEDELVTMLPDLNCNEDSARFRQAVNSRALAEIIPALDLYYCIHWGVRETLLRKRRLPAAIVPQVVVERRRALEWVLSDEGWAELTLDT
jgi:hypothetical protein